MSSPTGTGMTALVTGADRGLGLGLVRVLLESGYRVYAGSYLTDAGELAEERKRYPDDLLVFPLDVTDEESITKAAQEVSRSTKTLNLLINNAGNAEERSTTILEPMNFEDMGRLYEINTLGPLRVTHHFLPLLLASQPKTLVNISSLAASIGTISRTHQYGYAMSKAALNMQSKLIHNHLHDRGLRVLAVHPGWMRTHVLGDIDKMKDAPFEPEQAARNILSLIQSTDECRDHIFLDPEGRHLPW